jgi:hypothetical protein
MFRSMGGRGGLVASHPISRDRRVWSIVGSTRWKSPMSFSRSCLALNGSATSGAAYRMPSLVRRISSL